MELIKTTEYTTKTDYVITYEKLSDLTDVKNFKNGNDLFVIVVNIKETRTGFGSYVTNKKWQSIESKEVLDKILESPSELNSIKKGIDDNALVYLVKKDFLNKFTKFGLAGRFSLGKEDELKFSDFVANDVLANSKDNDFVFVQLINNSSGVKMFVESNGEKYIEPLYFDYISANLENRSYHLDDMAEYLSKRDDVAFLVRDRKSSSIRGVKLLTAPVKEDDESLSDIIVDIPGYNASEDCNETIQVLFYPKKEDIEKIMSFDDSVIRTEGFIKRKIWNLDSFIIKEVLGCDKFAKGEPVEPEEVPKRKFKR